ncbi:MAG: hypothetical protein DRQ60_06955 [Gammaproteobacteria bacterium]|nr:MAG: hypothetical protein DRQ54_01020 [Gammaproteobacteria bacterium]RLA14128.1 MAG: hypothetical protein DRQ60_06955 [Gammaproteobacteria bacterium]RLA15750.1 MAG: hypothetical protein DRQ52_01020 [Gammaproteobacteria bacterium]
MIKTTFNRQDRLGRAFIKAAIILGFGLIVTLGTWQFRASATAEEITHQRQMNYLRDEVARIRRDREWTEAYQPNYEKMVANGLVGEESRLEWRAMIVNLARRLKLSDVKMTLSPKKSRTDSADVFTDQNTPIQVSSYESQMALDLTLFHALDLLSLLDELDQSTTAILMPLRCQMSLDQDPFFLGAIPLIKSHCDLSWVTVNPTPPVIVDEYY